MVQEYTPTKAEDRPSNNVGVKDYLNAKWLPWTLIVGGGAIGYAAGKLGKNRLPFFDGKQPLKGLMEKGSKTLAENGEYERAAFDGKFKWLFGSKDKAANFRQNAWNIVKGVSLPAVYFAFANWKKEEGTQIGLYEIKEGVEEVDPYHMTNDDLRIDNEVTKRQIDHLREKRGEAPLFKVEGAELEGRAKEATSLEIF